MNLEKLEKIREAQLRKLDIASYDSARDAGKPDVMRSMYRQLYEIATTSQSAVQSLRHSQEVNYKPAKDKPDPEDFPTYTMTSGGRLWTWRCGWQEMDKLGKPIGKPIGHLAFRKFKLAVKRGDRWQDNWMKISRPEGPWRRHIDCILVHPELGHGKVLATDGVHAVFEFDAILNHETGETVKRKCEVSFSRLSEVAVSTPHNRKSGKPVTKSEKKEAKPKISVIALDLL